MTKARRRKKAETVANLSALCYGRRADIAGVFAMAKLGRNSR